MAHARASFRLQPRNAVILTGWIGSGPVGVRPTSNQSACLTPVRAALASWASPPTLVLDRKDGHVPFNHRASTGLRLRPSTCVDDLAPAFRKASARHLEPKSAIDERYVCPCRSVMRPVRPSGTPATDSPSAPGVRCSFISKTAPPAGDGLHRAHRGADSSQPNGSGVAAKRHPRHRSAYPDGDRSIRPRVTPLTYPRSKTRDANAGSPRSNRFLVFRPMVGSGCLS